jgi:ATP-binding cassette subfamily C protein CydC
MKTGRTILALRLVRLAAPIRGWMLLAALLSTATVICGLGLLATSGYLISEAALHPSVAALGVSTVGVRFFGIARGVFRYLERLVSHRATFRLLARLRIWFYAALEPLLPASLVNDGGGQALRSGDLLRRVVGDIDLLQSFYLRVLAPPAVAALVGITMWGFLGAFALHFALLYLTFYLLASIGVPLLAHLLSQKLGAEIVHTKAELHAHLVDSIQGSADLLAFGQEESQSRRIQNLSRTAGRLQMAMARVSGLQGSLGSLLMNVSAWAMLVAAIPLVHAGQLNGVNLAVLVLATLASFEIVQFLPSAFQQIGGNLEAARRLFEIVDLPPAIQQPTTPAPRITDYRIAVKGLSFRYAEAGPEILRDISFELPQGHCLALVGASGAGKSTLAHLLLRYREYKQGSIQIGGHEIRDFQSDDLYRLIAVVEQDTYLFNTTIRENLLLARPEASEEELLRATRRACLHEFVQTLPAGYDTQVGEQGLLLSGGERQRIALARALLKDAPILILDEPTVNLDALNERAILHTLHEISQERTTLLITHRLIEMEMADEILVLEHGRIVERGKHTELLENEGIYWQMYQKGRGSA